MGTLPPLTQESSFSGPLFGVGLSAAGADSSGWNPRAAARATSAPRVSRPREARATRRARQHDALVKLAGGAKKGTTFPKHMSLAELKASL